LIFQPNFYNIRMNFTLVSTVFNEAKRLDQTISDLVNQTLQPSEIIIVDAGSTDGTYEALKKWSEHSLVSVIVLQKLRCNVAEGRNIAIKAAKYDLIASMDFGCRYDPKWLESIIEPFKDRSIDVVFGAYKVDETEQISLAAKAAYINSNGYKWNFHSGHLIPTSRSIAYKKKVFHKIGGYCEWLTLAADDTVFGKQIKANGFKMYVADRPYSTWMRHETLVGFVKESYRYGLGNGEAKIYFDEFMASVVKLFLRIGFYLSGLFFIMAVFLKISVLFPIICLVGFVYGFRIQVGYLKNWYRLQSKKYGISVLLYGLYLSSAVNYGYIKGYIKGYYYSTEDQKQQAELLQKRINKIT